MPTLDDNVKADKKPSSASASSSACCSIIKMQKNALEQIQNASQGIEDAEAFHEACQRVPQLVAEESNPLWFIRFEKSNAMAAARRMVSYWKERKAAFGDERAFLPMNLVSGHGALSPEDVNTLQAGHWLHLPRCDHHHQQNKSRCTVLYHDHSMEPHEDMTTTTAPTTCSFARIIFFMLQIALENEASREQGFVLLLDVSNPFAACFDEAFEETMRGLMSKAMPMKIYHINLICNPPPFNDCNDRKAFVKTTLAMAQKRLGSFLDEQMSTNVVVAESNQDCLHQLSLLGLSRESLPSCFGGTFRGWQPWRRSHHEQDHEGKAHHHHDGDHPQDDEYMLDIVADYPCLVRNTIWKYTQQSTATTTSTSTDAASARQSSDEAAAQGAKNAASAAPIPAKIEANKARVRDPNTATPSGKTGKKSTRKAIGGGNPKVGEEEDQKLKKRRLDAIYAQRKREKLRIETEVLQDQCKKANELSSSLRLENEKLEGLVYAAKQMVELYEQNKMLNASSSALPAAALNNGGAAYYPAAAWLQQPPSLLQQQQEQDFRMHKAALAALPPHQRQLLLAQAMQQQNAFAPPGGGMLR